MVTTIQVREETLEMLKQLRRNLKASSYDEVITKLVREPGRKNDYGRGILGKRGMKWVMEDLRDKSDRF